MPRFKEILPYRCNWQFGTVKTKMSDPPPQLDGANVLYYAFLNDSHENTGRVKHFIESEPIEPVPVLAICQYAGKRDAYLFFCDAQWQVVQDDQYSSVDEALADASEQYEGLTLTDWHRVT